MISLMLQIATQQSSLEIYELIEKQNSIVVQATIKAQDLNDRELANWYVLGDVLLKGTVEYTAQQIRDFGSQAGVAPEVIVMPDFMRIQFVVPEGGLSLAGDLLYSVMARCSLLDRDVTESITLLKSGQSEPWLQALTGYQKSYDRIRQGDVRSLWSRVFVPKNFSFVVGGAIRPGEGKAEIARRFSQWKKVQPGVRRLDGRPKPLLSTQSRLSTFVLSGKPLTPASNTSAAKLLAVFAIGVGKDASMHRVLREELGLAYLQFAVLWPTLNGWRPSFVMVRKAEVDEGYYVVKMRDALLADIDKWNIETVLRAHAMAESAFGRNFSSSPVWLTPEGPMTDSLQDRCAWRGYLEMVGSGALDERILVLSFQNVDLDQLKVAARSLLDECNAGWLPGTMRN